MTEKERIPLSSEAVHSLAKAHGLEIDLNSIVKDDSGSDFIVFHCASPKGERWICRIPRRDSVAAVIPAEEKLLNLVRPVISVEVPDWEIVSDELIAYRRIGGRPAAEEDSKTRELIWSLDQSHPPDVYIAGLAQTMVALHALPRRSVLGLGLPVRSPDDVKQKFAKRLERGRVELRMDESWWARGQAWLANEEWWPRETVLIHGDLHPGHTLIDPSGAITGILDWSDAEVGDPGQEFIECLRKFPPATVDRLITAYQAEGGHIWSGMSENIQEGIAFAPLYLGLMGIDAFQPRYVARGKAVMCKPVPTLN